EVPGRNDETRAEAASGIGEPAHVVRDRGNTGAERAQERAALVELRPVGKDRHRRLAERPVELVVGEVAEPPFDLEAVGGRSVPADRLERIAGDEQPSPGTANGLDRVAEAFVFPD